MWPFSAIFILFGNGLRMAFDQGVMPPLQADTGQCTIKRKRPLELVKGLPSDQFQSTVHLLASL